jgi:hypothetical protein
LAVLGNRLTKPRACIDRRAVGEAHTRNVCVLNVSVATSHECRRTDRFERPRQCGNRHATSDVRPAQSKCVQERGHQCADQDAQVCEP